MTTREHGYGMVFFLDLSGVMGNGNDNPPMAVFYLLIKRLSE